MIKRIKAKPAVTVLAVLLILTVAFIWINSLLGKEASSDESESVTYFIRPFLEIFLGEGNVTGHFVRKLAHFSEFGLLGCELAMLLILLAHINPQHIANISFFAMFVALSDETIQIFTGRGPQISDVWIDVSGACTGIVVVFVIYALIRFIKKRKLKRGKPSDVRKTKSENTVRQKKV